MTDYEQTEPKSVYLAGKIAGNEGTIAGFADELELRGHAVLEKWFEQGRLPRPYLDHREVSEPAATAMINAAIDSDVFVLFPTERVLGAAVELGAALASTAERQEKKVYIVKPAELERQSVFYAHPAVFVVDGLQAIREQEWY